MKVLFLGQGRLACLCLRVLMGSGFKERISLASIVTNESFYEGLRSENEACRDLPFISNHVRNEQLILESVESMGVDALVSVQHKWILSSDVISSVSGKVFNLHNAKLPDYKGHNTISFAILNDEKNYSVTIHWVVPEVDEGDLIKESVIPISPEDTALSLYRKTLPVAESTFREFLDLMLSGDVPRSPLSGGGVFYGKTAWEPNKLLQLGEAPEAMERKVRASYFPPYEPAYLQVSGKKVYRLPESQAANPWHEERPLNKSEWEIGC